MACQGRMHSTLYKAYEIQYPISREPSSLGDDVPEVKVPCLLAFQLLYTSSIQEVSSDILSMVSISGLPSLYLGSMPDMYVC